MLHLLHKGAVGPKNIGIVRRVLDCPAEQRVRLTVSSRSRVSAGKGTGAERGGALCRGDDGRGRASVRGFAGAVRGERDGVYHHLSGQQKF